MTPGDPISLYDRLMAIKPPGLSPHAWRDRAGVNSSIFTDIRNRGTARHETIVKLVEAAGLTMAEFEAGVRPDQREPSAVRSPAMDFRGDDRPRDVPVMGTAECADLTFGEDGAPVSVESMQLDLDDIVDHVRRPAALDNRRDVYALYFRGHSLAPKFEPGELAFVDPRRPPAVRDYVVVQLRAPSGDGGERVVRVIAKRLVRQSATFVELEQYDPPLTFKLTRDQIAHIHRIMPLEDLVSF